MLATTLAFGLGGGTFALVWGGAIPFELPTWWRIYLGVTVGFTMMFFLTREFAPPTPLVAPLKPCPRCDRGLHYTGYECPECGVLSFSHDRTAGEIEA